MPIFKYYIHITLQISNLQLHKELIMSLGENNDKSTKYTWK